MTEIEKVSPLRAKELVRTLRLNETEAKAFDYCFVMSTVIWAGLIDGKLAAMWGLIPPTLMSNQAYLWLYTTNVMKEHQFILVRHSQLVMEEILKEYPSVCGHATIGDYKAIWWLKWLGAKFSEPYGHDVMFRIKRNG